MRLYICLLPITTKNNNKAEKELESSQPKGRVRFQTVLLAKPSLIR